MSKKGLDDRPVSDYEEFALNVVRRASLASQTSVAASSSSLFGKVGFAQPKLEVYVVLLNRSKLLADELRLLLPSSPPKRPFSQVGRSSRTCCISGLPSRTVLLARTSA